MGLPKMPLNWLSLLCTQTTGSKETFTELAYIKNGIAAIEHLFEVAAGLDSQILGDYEIVGQMKQAVKFAREHRFYRRLLGKAGQCRIAIFQSDQKPNRH